MVFGIIASVVGGDVLYPGVEVGGDLAQADGGVAPDWALFVSGLQPGKVTHQFLVQVGLIQLGSQQQHGLERLKKTEELWLQQPDNIQYTNNETSWSVVVFKHAKYLNSLFSDCRVGVCEAVNNVRENLGIDCCLIQILNELLHLRQETTLEQINVFIL